MQGAAAIRVGVRSEPGTQSSIGECEQAVKVMFVKVCLVIFTVYL